MFSNLSFYFTILVAIPFYANWFAAQGHTDDGLLWIYVETFGTTDVGHPGGPGVARRRNTRQSHGLTCRFGSSRRTPLPGGDHPRQPRSQSSHN